MKNVGKNQGYEYLARRRGFSLFCLHGDGASTNTLPRSRRGMMFPLRIFFSVPAYCVAYGERRNVFGMVFPPPNSAFWLLSTLFFFFSFLLCSFLGYTCWRGKRRGKFTANGSFRTTTTQGFILYCELYQTIEMDLCIYF